MTDGVFIPPDMPTRTEIDQATRQDQSPGALLNRWWNTQCATKGYLTPIERDFMEAALAAGWSADGRPVGVDRFPGCKVDEP